MGRKSKIASFKKIEVIEKYLRGEDSLNHLAEVINVSYASIKQWLQTYLSLGADGLLETSKNSVYTKDFKTIVIQNYLSSNISQMDICKKYGIKSTSQLRNWILKYNGHEELKSSGTGGISIMTKGRKTTYEERVDIVKYCIEHQNNYAETAEHFQVSYQQVYSWVAKYEKDGVEALQDKRGKRNSVKEMSELEKLKAENKLLQAENRRKQMELDFLKKLEEIERGRY
jgi:transposase-like protein